MKCISDTYNIYLTEDNTLLFYDTLPNGELDKVNVEIINATPELIELAEVMSQRTRQEIWEITHKWQEKNGTMPDIVKAILHHMLYRIKESDA